MKHLKEKKEFTSSVPTPGILDTFRFPGVSQCITLTQKEFTSLCPITGQPDYAEIEIEYTPNELCVESKSLKLYLGAYRNYGGFAEAITYKIAKDLYIVLNPTSLRVTGRFVSRGGISIEVTEDVN